MSEVAYTVDQLRAHLVEAFDPECCIVGNTTCAQIVAALDAAREKAHEKLRDAVASRDREIVAMRELIDASREVAEAADVFSLRSEIDRMRLAFRQMVDKFAGGVGFQINFSGCEWCEEIWPKVEGQSVEQTREVALLHVRHCAKNPIAAELDALREKADAVVERMVRIHYLYNGHTVDNRGPRGCIWDAIEMLAPDVADEVKQTSWRDVYVRRYSSEDDA